MNFPIDEVIVERVRKLEVQPPAKTPLISENRWPIRSLHLNESPLSPSPKAIAAMQESITGLNRYPDHEGAQLVHLLAQKNAWPAEQIVIGAGSNELLYASADISLNPGDEAIVPSPGFPTYAKTITLRGAKIISVPVRDDGIVDVDTMLAAVTSKTKLMFVSSPHNPTGGLLDRTSIAKLVMHLPSHVLLHFDEAYYEFGCYVTRQAKNHQQVVENTLEILKLRKAAWIATRSFSKTYCLAGIRLGYGMCSHLELAQAYKRIRVNFSVNSTALAGAIAAMEDEEYTTYILDKIAQGKDMLEKGLRDLGFTTLPSATNFVAALYPETSIDFCQILRQRNIYILAFPWKAGKRALRITVGNSQDNHAVLDALKFFQN